MKKNLLYLLPLAALAAVASCQVKEDWREDAITIEHTVSAHILAENQAKTQLSDEWKVLWEEGDAIAMYFDGNEASYQFALSDGAGTTSALFKGPAKGDNCLAVYPYDIAGAAVGADAVKITLPAEQMYSSGSFGSGSNPMLGKGNGATVSFKNACALLKLSIKGHHSVKEIIFQANDSAIKVSGAATASFDSQGNPVLAMDAEASSSVSLVSTGVLLNDDVATDFYLALPPQTYKGGFTVTVITSTGSMEKKLNTDFTMARAMVHEATPFQIKLDTGIDPSTYLQGGGTESNPFLINSLADLLLLQGAANAADGAIRTAGGSSVSVSGAWFRQTADIDLGPVCSEAEGSSWTPIGDYNSNDALIFLGDYDGGGHSITGLYINAPSSAYQGLFGYVIGDISNLSVEGTIIANKYAGLLSGAVKGSTTKSCFVMKCSVSGSVTCSKGYSGGLTGTANNFTACTNYASVNGGGNYVGGITGDCSGTVRECINYGNVRNSGQYLGGIVGYQNAGHLFNCSNEGDVIGYVPVGGISGYSRQSSQLINCINKGYVYSSYGYVGGICGHCDEYEFRNYLTSIRNCVNAGRVEVSASGYSKDYIGGICGYNVSTIKNCYWIFDEAAGLGVQAGIGYDAGVTESNYPLTEAQLKGESTGFTLYSIDETKVYNTLVKALNAWAYANATTQFNAKTLDFRGWQYSQADGYPELTDSAPVLPSGDEQSDFFTITPLNLTVDGKGGTFEISVYTNLSYYTSYCADWITENSVTQTAANTWTHVYTVGANPDMAEREDLIVLCDSRGVCNPVTVKQEARPDYYFSTDYSQDGVVTLLQQATEGNGINIVLMGDAFSDRQIADGTYAGIMYKMADAFFSEEPYKSFRSLFNVSMVNVVSETEGYEHGGQALETYFGNGTTVGGNDGKCMGYAEEIVGSAKIPSTLIIVAMNSSKYAGTCWMYYPSSGDYGQGVSVAYFPIGSDDEALSNVLHHEAGGHGFAKLGDEYAYESQGSIPASEIEKCNQLAVYGWWKNVDFTAVASDVKWSKFLSDNRYAYDGLGVYEGAYTYWTGAYRPTVNSIMRYNTDGFNAPSREAIWYRIHKLAYGDNWQYDYEEFVAYDAKNRKTAASAGKAVGRQYPPLDPPVVVNRNWEEVLIRQKSR